MFKRILTILLVYVPAGFVVTSVLLVTLLKWVPVTITPLMVRRSIESIGKPHHPFQRKWVPLENISDNMIRAVIAAEDQKFLCHDGFDFEELGRMKQEHISDGFPLRGCSTISQQTAKNCFTFCTGSWLRKGVEAYYTVLIEWIWGKDRIMEVYLNVAEFGRQIYGIEAAAQHYYSIRAEDLTLADATSLACCLPNPLHRDPDWVNRHLASRRSEIAAYSMIYAR
ncbi:MAG: monofunctional biosynthetic peptidoglycan transglycosylase [Candidatus Cryptobacteroides sp.]|nr:monofunctional biosynthetic peptidoglycan transglycosylase [Bacteroidales bacterium]MDY5494681.1 monofunctional biosynthetic peptidoglycan transglycosylase [Candidatus Cryptobacteroides sp.]